MEILLQVNKRTTAAYFDIMLPILPNICNNYSICLPTFHLPLIKHAFAEQRLDYQLIRMLNAYDNDNDNGNENFLFNIKTFSLEAQSLIFLWFKNFCENSIA